MLSGKLRLLDCLIAYCGEALSVVSMCDDLMLLCRLGETEASEPPAYYACLGTYYLPTGDQELYDFLTSGHRQCACLVNFSLKSKSRSWLLVDLRGHQ